MVLKQNGLSIIECLLAVTFSCALIWQVFVIYQDVHETHELQASMSQLLHHAQWFEDVMGDRILQAGNMTCVSQASKESLKKQIVQAYTYNHAPSDWSIDAAKSTQILILGSCQKQSAQDLQMQWLQTAYYLEKNSSNALYTLYQKQKGFKAMAMQDDIASLHWFLVYATDQEGVSSAPQEVGSDHADPIVAVAWQVSFSSPTVLIHLKKALSRIFYGYMSLHDALD
jgi:hypothetical protein